MNTFLYGYRQWMAMTDIVLDIHDHDDAILYTDSEETDKAYTG